MDALSCHAKRFGDFVYAAAPTAFQDSKRAPVQPRIMRVLQCLRELPMLRSSQPYSIHDNALLPHAMNPV
jgi:hypothetical protein